MTEIIRIDHIGLRVSDFEVARDFYAKLGFEDMTGPVGPEPVALIEHPGGICINFILNADVKRNEPHNILMAERVKHTGYTHVALAVSDMSPVLKQLNAQGIALSGGPMDHPDGTSYFIRDPDANVIELIEKTAETVQ